MGHYTIGQRFRRRCQEGGCGDGGFARLTADLEPDLDTVMVAGTLVKVPQHGTGAPQAGAHTTPDDSRAAQAIGVSRGGLTTRIVAMVDQGGPRAGWRCCPETVANRIRGLAYGTACRLMN